MLYFFIFSTSFFLLVLAICAFLKYRFSWKSFFIMNRAVVSFYYGKKPLFALSPVVIVFLQFFGVIIVIVGWSGWVFFNALTLYLIYILCSAIYTRCVLFLKRLGEKYWTSQSTPDQTAVGDSFLVNNLTVTSAQDIKSSFPISILDSTTAVMESLASIDPVLLEQVTEPSIWPIYGILIAGATAVIIAILYS